MNLWHSLGGLLQIRITCADPEVIWNLFNIAGICLLDIEPIDMLTFRCKILRADWKAVQTICNKNGCHIHWEKKIGLYWWREVMLHRPVLTLCVLFFLLILGFLPTRVLFFEVSGNKDIPDQIILEAAEQCGISFGASRKNIRSEKMKNALLEALPQLQWAGINTYGCRAVISVKERVQIPESKPFPTITSVVAERDGIITSCTSTKGNAVCTVGQSVKKDQLLISPYVDCGISIKVVPAEGEVYANTNRKTRTIIPSFYTKVHDGDEYRKRISLIFGKKRINLQNGSGIFDATCDRMYMEYYITLPGGFRLPFSLAVETILSRTCSVKDISQEVVSQLLQANSRDYVCNQMISGSILSESHAIKKIDSAWILDSNYMCSEMIGRIAAERNGVTHE